VPDTVLLVDDDEATRRALGDALERAGFEVHREAGGGGIAATAAQLQPGVVLIDVRALDRRAPDLLGELRAHGAAVVALAGPRDLDAAIHAVEAGAESFVAKSGDPVHLVAATARAAEKARLARELTWLRDPGAPDLGMLGVSPAMRALAEVVARTARQARSPVLLVGEPGTGKQRVARVMHALGPRAGGPFIAAPRGGTSIGTLVGQERGAAGDRRERRAGLMELADRGTLFVPDVTTLPDEAQRRLVDLLDGGRLRRLGGTRDVAVDTRLIASTDRDLVDEMRVGRVREDLLYRLTVGPIVLPPLRERARDDRVALVERLLAELAVELAQGPARCTAAAQARLADAPWPGNVREMRNVIERAMLAARGADAIDLMHLPGEFRARGAAGDRRAFLPSRLVEMERLHIERALRHFGGNRTRTALALGISRATLINKIRSYGLSG